MAEFTTLAVRHPRKTLSKWARDIVTGNAMFADLHDRLWQQSLWLLLTTAKFPRHDVTLGGIVVPYGPHMGGRWINGKVPAVTVEMMTIHVNDMEFFNSEWDRFYSALRIDDE